MFASWYLKWPKYYQDFPSCYYNGQKRDLRLSHFLSVNHFLAQFNFGKLQIYLSNLWKFLLFNPLFVKGLFRSL